MPSDLPAPATMAGAPPDGPPPGPAGSNGPSHGYNRGPHLENKAWDRVACARRMGNAPPWVRSWFQPIAHPYGPPTDLLRPP
ncbi:hypothetical protein F511_33438 [Dorcoceras hygrometricum]|uniref:Uncharacterized protein n=1 Tax=Dorcoceras hygrometricum TaxID=472368 RepID=A0A2Z7APH5_9LAMI|nr:hypothetical protein F511_33438 [Dorcoceras hygrometricum]